MTFAERHGAVVGMASGYTAEEHRCGSEEPLREAVRFYERRGMTVSSRWPRRVRLPGLRLYRMTVAVRDETPIPCEGRP